MKCPVCEKEVGFYASVSLLDDEIKLHLDCFFEGIPNPTSHMEINHEEKSELRKRLIDEKANKIIEEYKAKTTS